MAGSGGCVDPVTLYQVWVASPRAETSRVKLRRVRSLLTAQLRTNFGQPRSNFPVSSFSCMEDPGYSLTALTVNLHRRHKRWPNGKFSPVPMTGLILP